MKRLRLPIPFSIKTNMILAFLGVSLISILILNLFTIHYFSEAVKKDFFTISGEAQSRLNYHLDDYFKQIASSTSTLLKSDLNQSWLSGKRVHTSDDIDNIQMELKRYVAFNFPEIIGMFLVNREQRIISMTGNINTDSLSYRNEPWYDLPPNDSLVILPTHRTAYPYPQQNGTPVLSLLIPIYSTDDLNVTGKLVIDITFSKIHDILGKSALGKTGFFFILADDRIVYHPNQDWLGMGVGRTDLASLSFDREEQSSIQYWNGDKMLVSVKRSTITDWNIVSIVPFDEMSSGLKAARGSTFFAFMIVSVAIIAVVPLVSNIFVKPIIRLKQVMQSVARGDFSVRAVDDAGQMEFQQLGHSFNRMVEQINELLETVYELRIQEMHVRLRQKEALIQALQNQINPHLLYNSLDIIKSIAYLENVPRVEKMAKNLADVYRYTAKYAESEVTIGDELTHLSKYLEIIRVRFPHYFESHIYVNEKFHDCLIEKLTLQPLVENAVKYGIEPKGGHGAIMVSAFQDDAVLVIEIADNGPGISEERMRELNERLAFITNHVKDKQLPQESLGIASVQARLVLKYGEDYGVALHSFPGRGTVVSIRIPYRSPKIG
ncbi:cache domain-containing sensor histidine kinase [Paenibacillus contaminans]|uniref:histidine kinase n=1 Tax=Paenibacillus contaminans TaxID=450362 RepID=A0A329M3R7_9BACL|nr:sensor histidine kinase [Paenibacillus contaminans]RAV13303.1 sensor histidine kinase [Paenibacillus contaminans]